MKFYILFILNSFLTAWVILLFLSISAGFASFIPIMALIGALFLFAIATPILLYKNRLGLILGLVFLVIMLPYTIGLAISGLGDRVVNLGTIFSFLPGLLALLTLYLVTKQIFFQKESNLSILTNPLIKVVLAAIPIGITILYFIFYGTEWF